jgi:hypothetical protein
MGSGGAILAIDPGRGKCGVAVVARPGEVLHQAVVPAEEIGRVVCDLLARYQVGPLVMGNRTAGSLVRERLQEAGVRRAPELVDEHRSSEEGRRRYFQANPPKGWRRLLPTSLQTPPKPYDDYVAILLAERYARARSES